MGKRKPPTKAGATDALLASLSPDEKATLTRELINPTTNAATTLEQLSRSSLCPADFGNLIQALREQTEAVNNRDLKRAEAMLAAQAHTLDALFHALAQHSAMNMGEHLDAASEYLKLALRAQAQSRATWETVSALQNPPLAGHIGQANIAHGHQQVNNGIAPAPDPCPQEKQNPRNELLEVNHGERLDTGTTGTTSRPNPHLAPLGAVDRAPDESREGEGS